MKKTWLFNWTNGGYNTVQAETREEALVLAKKIGEPGVVFRGLTVDESSLHIAAPGEVAKIDKYYAGMFD